MLTATIPRHRNHNHYALLTALVTVEKEIEIAVDGRNRVCIIEKDNYPGVYGFSSEEKRNKFKSLMNSADSEQRPCVAVSLQDL